MSSRASDPTEREERLHEVLVAYLEAAEAGREPGREELLADHPEFAAELAEFFAGRDELAAVMAPPQGERRPAEHPCGSGAAPAADWADGLPGFGRLGDFHLLREIGRGGMGVVYEAQQ